MELSRADRSGNAHRSLLQHLRRRVCAGPAHAGPAHGGPCRRQTLAANAKGRRARLCWLHAADFWTRVFVMFLFRIGIYQLSKMCSVGQKRLRLEHVLSASCSSCQTRGGEGGEEAS